MKGYRISILALVMFGVIGCGGAGGSGVGSGLGACYSDVVTAEDAHDEAERLESIGDFSGCIYMASESIDYAVGASASCMDADINGNVDSDKVSQYLDRSYDVFDDAQTLKADCRKQNQ